MTPYTSTVSSADFAAVDRSAWTTTIGLPQSDRLNADSVVYGMFVQALLPARIGEDALVDRIDPDSRGVGPLQAVNMHRLALRRFGLRPRTPIWRNDFGFWPYPDRPLLVRQGDLSLVGLTVHGSKEMH